jgi:DNA (cytosine-5)-methyltransferase 1
MKLLDLFCGAGGAAVGYHRAGFDTIVGVDIEPQPHYPFEFVQADALTYCAAHGAEFDAVHASPPCQAYTGMRNITLARFGHVTTEHPDMIAETRRVLEQTGKSWVIENVKNSPLRTQVILCGVSFGLQTARHRYFESSVLLLALPCAHYSAKYTIGVYGSRPDGRRVSYRHHRLGRIAKGIEEGRDVMGIDWMDWGELTQAVPPAYTEFIGAQLLAVVRGAT